MKKVLAGYKKSILCLIPFPDDNFRLFQTERVCRRVPSRRTAHSHFFEYFNQHTTNDSCKATIAFTQVKVNWKQRLSPTESDGQYAYK